MSSVGSAEPAQAPSESDESWGHRLCDILKAATAQVAAASVYYKESPNPMIQVVGPGDVVNLSPPLEASQLGALRLLGKLIPDANMGLEVIPNDFLMIRNPYWTPWVADKAQKLVHEKFLVRKTECQFEFAFVVSGDRPASGFGHE
jgi:hypothetical protein